MIPSLDQIKNSSFVSNVAQIGRALQNEALVIKKRWEEYTRITPKTEEQAKAIDQNHKPNGLAVVFIENIVIMAALEALALCLINNFKQR